MLGIGDTKGRVDEWNPIKVLRIAVLRMQLYDQDLLSSALSPVKGHAHAHVLPSGGYKKQFLPHYYNYMY